MEKINVAELLKDCPRGMKLDCSMWAGVTLERVNADEDAIFPIRIRIGPAEEDTTVLTEHGCWGPQANAKCVIFPKGKSTWDGFVPPCKN